MIAAVMTMDDNDRGLLLLAPEDNVVVACRDLAAGEPLMLDGGELRPAVAVGLGHKLARRAITKAEKIIKYGAPVGRATRAIAAGEHVHLHNMESDYIAFAGRGGKGGEG